MNKKKIASLEILNDKLYITPILSFMDAIAVNHRKMDISRYNMLRLVVGEILRTRIEKTYPGKSGKIYFEMFLSDTELEISVRDKGVPGWQDLTYDKDRIGDSKADLRNFMLDSFADGIGFEKLGKDGQRVFVRGRILNPIDFQEPEPYTPEEVLDENISIRPVVTEEDAIEAIRCIYSEYGYSYSYEGLYYVDIFLKKVREGELMSFLAVNDHGQTAGHFAMAFSDMYKNMPEISTVVIRREFRRLGLFAKFMDHCVDIGIKNDLRAIMGQPVGYHPMSQKAVLRAGFTATSLLMAYINSDVESEYNKNQNRLNLTAAVKILDPKAYSKVYPPCELKSFIGKIYDKLGWKYDFCEDFKLSDSTEICIEDREQLKMTAIVLRESAEDLEGILEDAVRSVIRKKNEMIELAILLDSPSCDYGYNVAKKCGFTVSGVIPGGENGDYLIMQKLTGDKMNYDALVMVGEFEDLKNDIVSLNERSPQ